MKVSAAAQMACWANGFAAIHVSQVLAEAGLEPQRNFLVVMDELWRTLEAGSGIANVGAPLHTDMLVRKQEWVGVHTQQALTGPLPGTDKVPALTSVPAVFVDGHHYPGNSDDQAAFTAFYNQHIR